MISNLVEVSWYTQDVSHPSPAYVAAVVLTERKTVPQLLARLTRPSSIRPSMETQLAIMQLLSTQHASQEIDNDVQIASTSLRLPLECPAMRSRMRLPARAGTCEHVHCFDLEGYIRMNEKRPSKARTSVHHSRPASFLFHSLVMPCLQQISSLRRLICRSVLSRYHCQVSAEGQSGGIRYPRSMVDCRRREINTKKKQQDEEWLVFIQWPVVE